jgi:dissimilatory sulfite reductase (desulfoviridin) alpha/beta subunit
MPWIREDLCVGCGICVDECKFGAITMNTRGMAEINQTTCVRCGHCHEACAQEAVRHDSERIPLDVVDNLQWVRGLLGHHESPEERQAFMQRISRFYAKQIKVNEKTRDALAALGDASVASLDLAIRRMSEGDHPSAQPRV